MIITFVCPSAPHPVGGVTALYEFAGGLARRGHEVHLVHAPFFRNRIDSLDDLAWFPFEPSVHHHLVDAVTGVMPRADVCFGISDDPTHGLPAVLIQGFEMLHVGLERAAFRTPAPKVCIASWLVEVGRRFGVPDEQLVVVHMGIDHDRYRVVRPIEDRGPVVGLLHASHEAKGWDVGMAALERVQAQVPELQVLAFGTSEPAGPRPPWLRFALDPDQEVLVADLYNRCSVFVQPSHHEGFGFTAVEAMACGAALVTTDNGGSRDYAHHDRTALTSPPGDPTALADHVLALLADEPRRRRLARQGRDLVAAFSWDQAAADLEAVLVRYLADPAALQHPPAPEAADAWDGVDPWGLRHQPVVQD